MIEESPDVFYLDVQVANINSNNSSQRVPAKYNESRTIPYLYNPSEYYGAITQFTLNNTDTPFMDVIIQPNQGLINLTIYQIVLSYNGVDVSQNIIYSPQNKTIPEPLPPNAYSNGYQNNDNGYYSIFSYSYFCSLLNKTFEVAYVILQSLTSGLPNNGQPVMKFNPETKLFYITVKNDLYNQSTPLPNQSIKISFNSALNHLFSFFTNSKIFINNVPYHSLLLNNSTSTIDLSNNILIMVQELSSINLWTQVSSIVITSQSIPVARSQTLNPLLYYSGVLESNNNNNSTTQQILLEYSVEDSLYSKTIIYNPSAQYRVFTLETDRALFNFDFQFYYRTTLGYIEPIYLNSLSSLSLKIGFFKKSKFSNLKNFN